ncbi:hypothetical protein ABZ641_32635, partial [Kitasatospora sp. NPDC007106]
MTDRDGERLLAIYLNDHLAGSYGGTALARRIARTHPAGPDAPDLRTMAREIAEDRDELALRDDDRSLLSLAPAVLG